MARAASASEAPVVIRSSTRTTRPAVRSRAPPGTTSSAPARFARRAGAPSPAWSATCRRWRSTGTTRAARPVRRSRAAAASAIRRVGSCPRARTERREDGTGTRSSGRSPGPVDAPPAASTAVARAAPRGRASVSAPRSLWASSSSRTASAYGAAAWTSGSPAGSGDGRTRLGPVPLSAPAHDGHSSVRGLPQPPQATGSTSPAISRHHPRMAPLCASGRSPATPVENHEAPGSAVPDASGGRYPG